MHSRDLRPCILGAFQPVSSEGFQPVSSEGFQPVSSEGFQPVSANTTTQCDEQHVPGQTASFVMTTASNG
ncbi:hypothetical protein CS378_13980 [Rhodococcus ruber]|nr:hypothetical protein CS378_13980 [Rhodococcus ruber]